MSTDVGHGKWIASADAWIADQGTHGDWSRRAILDPALEPLLSDISGQSVLDVGCGEGRYCRVMKARGAVVTGLDPVPKFLHIARERDPQSTYVRGIAESLPFADSSFDIVLSYLSFVDIPNLDAAAAEMSRVLHADGRIVVASISNLASSTPGWTKDESGRKQHRIVDRYMDHFAMDLAWRDIKIRNYHRPLSYVIGLFLSRQFVLTHFLEPLPDSTDPNYAEEFRVPTFQIYCFERCDARHRRGR